MSTSEPPFPLKEFLGLRLEATDDGYSQGSIEIGPEHLNPNGVVHGAVLFALIDTVMGHAGVSALPPEQSCTTVDLHIRFHRPAAGRRIQATARIIHQGRRQMSLVGEVRDADGKLVASATAGFVAIPAPVPE